MAGLIVPGSHYYQTNHWITWRRIALPGLELYSSLPGAFILNKSSDMAGEIDLKPKFKKYFVRKIFPPHSSVQLKLIQFAADLVWKKIVFLLILSSLAVIKDL